MKSKSDKSAESNPAVYRCCEAWRKAHRISLRDDDDEEQADSHAAFAYCDAMPPLAGARNTRDFIACVTHGLLIGAIDGAECSRLLYAVQVAHSTRRVRKSKTKTAENTSHSDAIPTLENAALEPLPIPVEAAQTTE